MTAQLVDVRTSAPVRARLTAVGAPVRETAPLRTSGVPARVVVRSRGEAVDAAWVAAAVARVGDAGVDAQSGAEWAQPVIHPAASSVISDRAVDDAVLVRPVSDPWQLTPRGMMVAVGLTALAAVIMVTTMVSAFLAVSDAPPAPRGAAVAVVVDGGSARS